jgi:hypothetical protein
MRLGELVGRQAADERFGEVAGGQAVQIAAHLVDETEPDLVRLDLALENPFLRLGNGDRLGE